MTPKERSKLLRRVKAKRKELQQLERRLEYRESVVARIEPPGFHRAVARVFRDDLAILKAQLTLLGEL